MRVLGFGRAGEAVRLLKSAFIVVGAVTMLVFGLDVAVQATTGHGFLLGVPTP